MASAPVEKKCRDVEWFTPPEIVDAVRRVFGGEIGLDPCTVKSNPTKARRFFTKEDDGIRSGCFWWCYDEAKKGIFVNPPYGKEMYRWIEKTVTTVDCNQVEAIPAALLLAASSRWDQPGWHRIFSHALTAMVLFRGRVKYLDAKGEVAKSPPYPSILFFYNVDPSRVEASFDPPHKVVRIAQRRERTHA